MAGTFYSNCSSLSIGCYLYTNYARTNPVIDGYFSDGTTCYTVTGGSGYISNISTCSTFVTIDTYTPATMNCFAFYDFAANSNAVVDTNVDVEITWTGDLGGGVTGTVTIFSGTNCNTVGVASGGNINCIGEFLSTVNVNLNPSSFGSQIYQVGTNSTGPYPC